MKNALITGITGQDGSYLTELLLEKGYNVYGIVRRSSTFNIDRLDPVYLNPEYREKRLFLLYGDLCDSSSINRIIEKVQPEEVYNLGAQSHVRISFDIPEYTSDVVALGTLRVLDAIRETKIKTRFYQASSSEMYGKVMETPQTEDTPFYPRSPYACAKVYGHWITKNYRESYGLHASNGILFNHESPRRGENFVTRKITISLARVKLGQQKVLSLGNLDAKRDWGYAKDYVEAMWLMLQQNKPDDYVIATNETHTVREFVEEVARYHGFDIKWQGHGMDEVGVDQKTGHTIINVDPQYFRPAEVDLLQGDYSKAKRELGWEPKIKFKELAQIMAESDYLVQSKLVASS